MESENDCWKRDSSKIIILNWLCRGQLLNKDLKKVRDLFMLRSETSVPGGENGLGTCQGPRGGQRGRAEELRTVGRTSLSLRVKWGGPLRTEE